MNLPRIDHEFTICFAISPWIHCLFFANSLSISWFYYEYTIYFGISLWIQYIYLGNSLWSYPTIPKSLSQNHYEYTIFSRIQYEFTIQFAYRPKMHYVFAKSVKSHYLFRDYLMNSLSYTIFIDFSNWIREITMISLSASGFILNLLSVSRIP